MAEAVGVECPIADLHGWPLTSDPESPERPLRLASKSRPLAGYYGGHCTAYDGLVRLASRGESLGLGTSRGKERKSGVAP
jgi:hypothetical protein